jgi:hypothetical protein
MSSYITIFVFPEHLTLLDTELRELIFAHFPSSQKTSNRRSSWILAIFKKTAVTISVKRCKTVASDSSARIYLDLLLATEWNLDELG